MSKDPEKQKLLAEQRRINLLRKQTRREIQQGKIKNGRDGIIRVPKNFRSLDEYEIWLYNEVCLKPASVPREYLGYFSRDGEYQGFIRIDPDEITGKLEWRPSPILKEKLRGKIVTHNHPTGNTFSYIEVLTCADLDFSEFRIVTQNFIYSLKPRNGEWPPWETIKRKIEENISPEKLDSVLRDNDKRHICYELLAKHGFFEYNKSPIPQ
jgi:hypothetical protein